MELEQLGWNAKLGDCESSQLAARVIVVDRDRYTVVDKEGESPARLSGKFRHSGDAELGFPCVGDWVCLQHHAGEDAATIERLLPRSSFLRRKSPGKNVEYQWIAANIDVAFIVQSCHFDFNPRRLERYLVMVNQGGIEPVLIVTKIDLIEQGDLQDMVARIRAMGYQDDIIALSNVTGVGIDDIRARMAPAKTYCLLGSSGVGKTTLINRLLGDPVLPTRTVSGTGEGRHTTVRRQLVLLDDGAMLVDTPGMRELGILDAGAGIEASYQDIGELAKSCRFADCTHSGEPGCSVLAALADESLDAEHYQNYLKIRREADFHDLSYSQKRKKDKSFGKMIHQMKKEKYR